MRIRTAIVSAVVLLAWAAPAAVALAATPTPIAPLPESPLVSTAQADLQARVIEAQTKARLYAGLAKAAAKSTANQDLYDVHWYDLNLSLNTTTHVLTGVVTTSATVTGASIATMDLDLKSTMVVTACTSAGLTTTWTRAGDVLTVNLDRAYATSEVVTVAVTYHGNPAGDYFGWDSYLSYPLVWTLSEPFGAREWWPCKDNNTDKADSVDVTVTLPSSLIVGSNGKQISDTPSGGNHIVHWHESYPICTYLVAITCHPYTVWTQSYTPLAGGSPMEIRYYVVQNRYSNAQVGYAPVPSMIHAFAEGFGEYPFLAEKYGMIHFLWGGGMEHQTLTSIHYNIYNAGIIAHELSHQWWGDMITCADFHHVWLNEGFATWCEAYWREQSEGIAGYHAEMDAAAYYGPGTIYVEDLSNFNAIFDSDLSYNKASWVLHMLRHILGDTDFFAALHAYRATYEYGSATTEQFRDVCESVSGKDLHPFFQQWIYGEYFPQYQYSWQFSPLGDSTRVGLRIKQAQTNTGVFTLPIDVFVDTNLGTTVQVVQNSEADQIYSLTVPGVANNVTLDRDGWILKSASGSATTAVPVTPLAARLEPNRPNPFNPATAIPFELPRAGRARLAVYDAAGRLVRTLVDGEVPAGRTDARWDGRDDRGRAVAAGTYYARLTAGDVRLVRALALVK